MTLWVGVGMITALSVASQWWMTRPRFNIEPVLTLNEEDFDALTVRLNQEPEPNTAITRLLQKPSILGDTDE